MTARIDLTRAVLLILALLVRAGACAEVAHAEPADDVTVLPAGTTVTVPGEPSLKLPADSFLLTRAAMDDAVIALELVASAQADVAQCRAALIKATAPPPVTSGWVRAATWAGVGVLVGGAFVLGLSL